MSILEAAEVRDNLRPSPAPGAASATGEECTDRLERQLAILDGEHGKLFPVLAGSGGGPGRAAAARELGRMRDPRAVEGLIAALRDDQMEVRCAAAKALGQIGDARATEPLIEALRSAFDVGSARRQRAEGYRLVGATAGMLSVTVAVAFAWTPLSAISVFPIGVALVWNKRLLDRRNQGPFIQAATQALAWLSDRRVAAAEMAKLAAELRQVSADFIQQSGETRVASRNGATRIEASLARSSLPIASAAPEQQAGSLPLPAESAGPDPRHLPRVEAG